MSDIKKDSTIKNIGKDISGKIEELLEKAGKTTLSKEESTWVRDTFRLFSLKTQTTKKRPNKKMVVILLSIIVFVSLLMLIKAGSIGFINPISSNYFTMTIMVNSLKLQIGENPDTEILSHTDNFYCTYIEANTLDQWRFSNLHLFHSDTVNKSDLVIEGDSLAINSLEVTEKAWIKISKAGKLTQLEIWNSSLSGILKVNEGKVIVPGILDRSIISSDDSEFISFNRKSKSYYPTKVTFNTNPVFSLLNGKNITELVFFDDYIYGADAPMNYSTINKGKILLHSINKEIELRKSEELVFSNLSGFISELKILDEGIQLEVSGKAKKIEYGPKNLRKNLAPTLLAYILNNQPLILMWSSIVFLWGLAKNI